MHSLDTKIGTGIVVGEDDIETEDYSCKGTIKHWKWWMQVMGETGKGLSCHSPFLCIFV